MRCLYGIFFIIYYINSNNAVIAKKLFKPESAIEIMQMLRKNLFFNKHFVTFHPGSFILLNNFSNSTAKNTIEERMSVNINSLSVKGEVLNTGFKNGT